MDKTNSTIRFIQQLREKLYELGPILLTNKILTCYWFKRCNKKIISNLYLAKKLGKQVIIRVPYIKGVNTDGTFLTDLSALVKDAGVNIIHLLPFHQFGKSKWEALRYDYAFSEMEPPSNDEIAFAKNFLENRGFQVDVGGANIYQ